MVNPPAGLSVVAYAHATTGIGAGLRTIALADVLSAVVDDRRYHIVEGRLHFWTTLADSKASGWTDLPPLP